MKTAATHDGSTTATTGANSSSLTSRSGRPTAAAQARSVASSSRSPPIQAVIGHSRGRIRTRPQPSAAAVSASVTASRYMKSSNDAS